MSYCYQTEKHYTLTDKGQRDVIAVLEYINKTISKHGAVRLLEIMENVKFHTMSSWERVACVDRVIEIGKIYEVTLGMDVAGQYRIFSDKTYHKEQTYWYKKENNLLETNF